MKSEKCFKVERKENVEVEAKGQISIFFREKSKKHSNDPIPFIEDMCLGLREKEKQVLHGIEAIGETSRMCFFSRICGTWK